MKYQIASDNTVLGKFGDVVDEAALSGCNIGALLSGGHLAPAVEVKPTPAGEATSKKE